MKKIVLPAAAWAILCSSCASLTKSQVEAVNHFSKTSANFSAYPSKVITALADVYVERGVYLVNSLDDFEEIQAASDQNDDSSAEKTVTQHINELDQLMLSKKKGYATGANVDITFKIIDKYIQSLAVLSSDKHITAVGDQAVDLGAGLDSLIGVYNAMPDTKKVNKGIGGLVGSVIMAGGKQWVRAKQANEIKRFVPAADEMIGVMTDNLLTFLRSGKIDSLIRNERQGIASDYKSFLRHRQPTVQNEREYLQLYMDVAHIDELRQQTISATRALRTAHAALTEQILAKKDVHEIITALQQLYEDVKEVKTTIKAIDAPKK
ncbi:MAG TPA: hypothetical protein VL307_17680 [Chitinophagaceae bacterium]|nr:hypothetical protein [Chitinophagaceae bacterium]